MARSGKRSPIKITHYLGGIDFSANRRNLIDRAGEQALGILSRMPDKEYRNMADVTKSMGKTD